MTEPATVAPARVPPHDHAAEAAVLSALLLAPDGLTLDEVREVVTAGDFFATAHALIFEAITDLARIGQPCDVVTVAAHLRSSGRLEQVGGTPYLATLTDATPALGHVGSHAAIVRDRAQVRALQRACVEVAEAGYSGAADAHEYLVWADQTVTAALEDRRSGATVETMGEALSHVVQEISDRMQSGGGLAGIGSGWRQIDWLISGWSPIPYVLAGRPGMGKSSWALQATLGVARGGHVAAFASAEMPSRDVVLRAVASEAMLDLAKLRSGKLSNDEWRRVTHAADVLAQLPWIVLDAKGLTVPEIESLIRRKVRSLQQRDPTLRLGLVVIDYVQILRGERTRGGNRDQEIGSIMREVMLATGERRLNCAVLALSQLNRELEKRPDKRPKLSDLRESGTIEQDGDTILALYRDDVYDQRSLEPGICEVICLKQRNGRTGTVKQRMIAEQQRFVDVADARDEATRSEADRHWSESGGGDTMGPPLFGGDDDF